MRYAIYYTPAQHEPLARLAASWLGRDAFAGSSVTTPAVANLTADKIADLTADPRRYGFHATLKAPFRLADNETEAGLREAVARFADRVAPVEVPLKPALLDGFLALVPAAPSPALDALAASVVKTFDRFRAPLTEAELARRKPERLTADEVANLRQWGYPYVFDRFRFHMTLTGRLAGEDVEPVSAVVADIFAGVLEKPISIDRLAIFVEPQPGAPFVVQSTHELGGQNSRKIA